MNRAATHQPEISLVNQRGTLQSVIAAPFGQTPSRHATQFFVDEGNQRLPRPSFPLAPSREQRSDLVGRTGMQNNNLRRYPGPVRRKRYLGFVRKSMHSGHLGSFPSQHKLKRQVLHPKSSTADVKRQSSQFLRSIRIAPHSVKDQGSSLRRTAF